MPSPVEAITPSPRKLNSSEAARTRILGFVFLQFGWNPLSGDLGHRGTQQRELCLPDLLEPKQIESLITDTWPPSADVSSPVAQSSQDGFSSEYRNSTAPEFSSRRSGWFALRISSKQDDLAIRAVTQPAGVWLGRHKRCFVRGKRLLDLIEGPCCFLSQQAESPLCQWG